MCISLLCSFAMKSEPKLTGILNCRDWLALKKRKISVSKWPYSHINSWQRGMAEQRSGLLLFLFTSASFLESEENEWRMVGEWHQQRAALSLHALVNLTGKTPTYLY